MKARRTFKTPTPIFPTSGALQADQGILPMSDEKLPYKRSRRRADGAKPARTNGVVACCSTDGVRSFIKFSSVLPWVGALGVIFLVSLGCSQASDNKWYKK